MLFYQIASAVKRLLPACFVALTLCLGLSASVRSAPGAFDPSFGPQGVVLTALGSNSFDMGESIAVQPDGKIVVVGRKLPGFPGAQAVIVRYNADGSLDGTFGTAGVFPVTFAGSTLYDVAVQPDGKIVVIGGRFDSSTGTSGDMLVIRLTASGAYDSSFNFNGWVFADFNLGNELGETVALQPDGKIIIGGESLIGSFRDYAIGRLNSDGSFDTNFGTGGKVVMSGNPFNGDDWLFDVAVQTDGKIIGAGITNSSGSSTNCFGLIRLNADGSPDSGFGTGGLVKTIFDGGQSGARGLALYPDGKIAVGGTRTGTSDDFAAARYNSDGTLDTTFDGDGKVTTAITNGGAATDATLQADGKFLLGGFSQQKAVLVRYNLDGSLDNSFGNSGISKNSLQGFDDKLLGIVILSDGKILATGHSGQNVSDRDIATVRYLANGMIDTSFGSPGRVHTSIWNSQDTAYNIITQTDGKIIAAGTTRNLNFREDIAIVRYLSSGAIDTTFGQNGGGKVVIPMNSTIESNVAGLALQPDGKIVVGSVAQENGIFKIVIARLNPDGTRDGSFGVFGVITLSTGTVGANTFIEDLALQADGKIVLGCLGGNPFDFILLRLNTDGSVDTSFDGDGRAALSLTTGEDRLQAIEIQPDGKIVAAGQTPGVIFGDSRIGVARFNTDGSPDLTFGSGGFTIANSGNLNINLNIRALALQPDGRIVVGAANLNRFAAARFLTNGALDQSFDGDGLALVQLPGVTSNSEVTSVAIQRNGKIVLGGFSFDSSEFDYTVVRMNPNGSADLDFDGDGVFRVDLGNQGETIYGITLQRDGKILLAGGINEYARRTFAILRLTGDPTGAGAFDFDGDGKTDIGIFRPVGAASEWWINRSSTGQTFALQFGASTDRITPADYTGDGKSDIAFFRPASGEWYVLRSEDFSFFALPFGTNGDVPVPADYDADGKADFAVFRPSSSTWFISQSSGAPTRIVQFGVTGDQPVVADYDADGKADIGIFRPAAGGAEWWIQRSTAGLLALQFGASTDKAVQGDYTGDGKADVAVWKPSTGEWFIVRSEDSSFYGFPFGASSDTPAPGDYDGDGKFDATVFRPSSATWFIARSTAGTQIVQFGSSGDRPLPNAYVP